MKIKTLHARQILDSRGNPTIECDAMLDDGTMGRAAVPSGASTGSREALELRDGDKTKYLGKGVLNAVTNVNETIAKAVVGMDAERQKELDEKMIDPVGAKTFPEALRMGSEVFHHLGKVLKEKGYPTTVGDEGGYAPLVQKGNAEALELIIQAIMNAVYDPGDDIALALDVAASELIQDDKYVLKAEKET